jgi:hypothetical protein
MNQSMNMKKTIMKRKTLQHMIRKIYIMLLITLFAISGVYAQVVKIEDVTVAPGNIEVEVNIDFTANVGAVTLNIDYDADLMSFTGIDPVPSAGLWVANASNGQIQIAFTAVGGVTFTNGKLLDLKFSYSGGFSAPLAFASGCELADGSLQLIPTTFTDGSVTQVATSNMISMTSPGPVLVGTTATVPVEFDGDPDFDLINSVTLKIAFNPAQLDYVAIDHNFPPGLVASASGGMLIINWSNPGAIDLNDVDLELEFMYYGGGNAELEFYPGCEIAYDLGIIPVEYANALITPLFDGPSITIVPQTAIPGFQVCIPLNADGFADYVDEIGAITINIGYDASKLTYAAYTSPITGWVVSASGGVLSINRSNTGGITLDPSFMNLHFIYNGGGDADLVFSAGTIISDINAETIPVEFVNGQVNPDMTLASTLTIGMVSGTTATPVTVPIDADGFPDVGSITIKVGFPANKLTYTGYDDVGGLGSWVVSNTANQVTFNWIGGPTGINGTLLNLHFIYTGTGAAPVVFNPGVEITNPLEMVEMTLIDGGVNVAPTGYLVSGYLMYANTVSTPLGNSEVYLKTSDGLTTLFTAMTDADGYFEFTGIVDGDYMLDATTIIPWDGVDINDAINILIAPTGTFEPGTLLFMASDLDENGIVDVNDAIWIAQRVADPSTYPKPISWSASDWVFDNPEISVSGGDVSINIYGLCSGDTNTSYQPASP